MCDCGMPFTSLSFKASILVRMPLVCGEESNLLGQTGSATRRAINPIPSLPRTALLLNSVPHTVTVLGCRPLPDLGDLPALSPTAPHLCEEQGLSRSYPPN